MLVQGKCKRQNNTVVIQRAYSNCAGSRRMGCGTGNTRPRHKRQQRVNACVRRTAVVQPSAEWVYTRVREQRGNRVQ